MKWNRCMFILGAALLMLSVMATAQPKFLVMSAKGKVEAKVRGNAKWQPVKVGMEIAPSATIKTSYSSYVKLMMDGSRLVGIDENTEKKLSDFASGRSEGKGSKTNAILAYAARQMKKGETKDKSTEFGAVRGDMEIFNATFPKYDIMSIRPEFWIVDEKQSDGYEVSIYDKDMKLVTKQDVGEERFLYPADSPQLAPGANYYWKVARKSDGMLSDVQRFSILHPDTIALVQRELKNIAAELTDMGADSVMHHLIRGVYFEQKQLFYDAYREYKTTVRMAPDVQEYKNMLSNLLLSMSLHNEEQYLLEE